MTRFSVPWQLEGERFIALKSKDKKPVGLWKDPDNQHNAADIQKYIDDPEKEYNYGVIYTTDLAVMDADNAEILGGVIRDIGSTYTVKSGRQDSTGKHLYLRICGAIPEEFAEKKILLEDPETGNALGDLRMPHSPFYNVAPYSTHPSGLQYLPIDPDAEIQRISFEELHATIEDHIKKPKHKPSTAPPKVPQSPSNLDDYGFTCFDFLKPLNPHERDTEIEGIHPMHGSTTGTNLTITKDGSQWYCRRCGTGGGWIKALAVSNGIIACSEANRELTAKEWAAVDRVLQHLNPRIYAKHWAEYKQRRASRIKERLIKGDRAN